MLISEEHKNKLCNEYFKNRGKKQIKLYEVVDKIIQDKFGGLPDKDEYYSLATEQFLYATEKYDSEKGGFNGFLYKVLENKIKSLMSKNNGATRSNGEIVETVDDEGNIVKRRVAIPNVSLDKEIGEDGTTIADIIANPKEFTDELLSDESKEYLRSLPDVQREIIILLTEGYSPGEIQKKLGLSPKVYSTEYNAATSYQNTKKIISTNLFNQKKKGGHMSETSQTSKQVVMTVVSYIDSVHRGDWCLEFSGQRLPGQWSHQQKGALIETILHDYQIPSLVVCEQKMEDGIAVNWVIDGMQRTSVLDEFLQNGFAVSRKIERPIITYQVRKRDEKGNVILKNGIPVFENAECDIRNKKFQSLPEELQKKVKDYSLHFEMYLGCTAEDVEYHERRYNGGKPMNQNQKGQTYLGQEFAFRVNEVLKRPFFKNTYKMSEYVSSSVNRLVDESVMAINFIDDWCRSSMDNCKFLRDNATDEMFDEIGDLSDRLHVVLSDLTRAEISKVSDAFIYFAVFKKFTELELDDSRFEDFMEAFVDHMKDVPVDGVSFNELPKGGSKNKNRIINKINHIERLMLDFLGIMPLEEEKVVNSEEGDEEPEKSELESYVGAFKALSVLPDDVSDEDAERVAVNVAEALMGDNDALPSDKFEDALTYTEFYRDDWMSIVDGTELENPGYLPALVATYRFITDGGNDGVDWFKDIAKNGIQLTGNTSTDFWILISNFKASKEKRSA